MDVVLVKLGGSLITDKRRRRTPRPTVIRRLARELARGSAGRRFRVVVGHGSGSFGHASAARHDLGAGVRSASQVPGVSRTHVEARRLNDLVVGALDRAALLPYALPPSGFMTVSDGRPARVLLDPLLGALDLGLTPVVFGDVVIDASRGASICSTESIFLALAPRLARRGHRVRRVLWLGETDGVYDEHGETIARLTAGVWRKVQRHVGGASGIDVTGGMALRVRTALRLARSGVESRILDGTVPGRFEQALTGRPVPGTLIE